jgi:3-dehydroquinate dehydratase/shikimate dehydrogenase
MSYLAVPITADSPAGGVKQAKAALDKGAQMLELRSDYLKNLTPDLAEQLIKPIKEGIGRDVGLIFTCRDPEEGGKNDYPAQLRVNVLERAISCGVDFVDCEYRNYAGGIFKERIDDALSQAESCRLILSAHNFEAPFEDLEALAGAIKETNSRAVPKLVYKARHINDCFAGYDLLSGWGDKDIILLCMGEAGVISRILAGKFGSMVSFASIDPESASAPGQVTIDELKNVYQFDKINKDTAIYGVIASPVGHSMSPVLHNSCFDKAGLDKVYVPLLVEGGQEQFDEFINNILQRPQMRFKGFSVTLPHKENALNFVKSGGGYVEPLTEKIGVSNTLIIGESGDLAAYNTDYKGAMDAIMSGMGVGEKDMKGVKASVLGAGGVARAIVAGLVDLGAKVKIYNRTVEKAERLAEEFECEYAGLDKLAEIDAELIVNCTSLGMSPNTETTALPAEYIKLGMAVFDTVYNPVETLLLKNAGKAGAKVIDGLSMFVNQAAEQFELFTDENADKEFMRKMVFDCLNRD